MNPYTFGNTASKGNWTNVRPVPAQDTTMQKTGAGLHVKCQLLLSDLNQNWNVKTGFSKTHQYQIS
jgi:hypothetical protein